MDDICFFVGFLFGLIRIYKDEIKAFVAFIPLFLGCVFLLILGVRIFCILGINCVIQCIVFSLVPTIIGTLSFIACMFLFYLLNVILQEILFRMGLCLKKITASISSFWRIVKKEIFNDNVSVKKVILLFVLLLNGPFVQLYVNVCGPVVENDNVPSFALGILGVQATMFTIVVALLSLITGKENVYLGMEIKKFYLQCNPKGLTQKGIIFVGVFLILISAMVLFLKWYNIVFVLFLYSLFLICLSVHRIYEIFFSDQMTFDKRVSDFFNDVEKFETPMLKYHLECLMEDMKNNRELSRDALRKYQELKDRMELALLKREAF